ncbi:MAG: YkgJ family cysteine cluster protein [Bryobacteraceae bacterium]
MQIERLGEKKRDENQRLRVFLKRRTWPERRLKGIAQKFEEEMDCTTCANCCKVATVPLAAREVRRLARRLGAGEAEFLARYTTEDEEGRRILRRTAEGCVFLAGNLCSIYEDRPRTCENFPHLARGDGSLVSRMWQMPDRATYCPIAYNTLEAWKREVGFR